MRGKTTRKIPNGVDTEENITLLIYFYKLHNFVTLIADAMFFKGDQLMIIS